MRFAYSIKLDDFKALQRPFSLQAGKNNGFKGVLVGCALMTLLGLFCLIEGMGFLVGGFLIGLGLVAAFASYLYEKLSVAAKKKKYDQALIANYQRIHCRDSRTFEANENGLSLSCKCQTLTRPWSELLSFSENEKHFAFATKMGGQILPKSAFPAEGDITQFRALVSDKLNQDKPSTNPHCDITYTPDDYRKARSLHSLNGGGWRAKLWIAARSLCVIAGVCLLWNALPSNKEALRAGLIGGALAVFLVPLLRDRRKNYLGKVRVYFGPEGMHAQYPSGQSRTPWSQFIGYLENEELFLLYRDPKLYSVVPKSALGGQAEQFATLVRAKLPVFDYRHPDKAQFIAPEQSGPVSSSVSQQ